MQTNILLADDHVLFRDGLGLVLGQLGGEVNLLTAGSFEEALGQAEQCADLDLAMLDLDMPGMRGAEGVRRFRQVRREVPVVVVTASEDPDDVQRMLDAGAVGYIPKSSHARVMLSALRLILEGGVYVPPLVLGRATRPASPHHGHDGQGQITGRQLEVLCLLLQGKANKVMARELNLSEGTIKVHLAALFRALDVDNRTEAALAAQARGWDQYCR